MSSMSLDISIGDLNSQNFLTFAEVSVETKRSKKEITDPWWSHFVGGEVGGMLGAIGCHPFDTAKVKAQVMSTQKVSMFKLLPDMVRQEGVLSLWRGVLYPFFGNGLLFSIAFGVNGLCRDRLVKYHEQKNNTGKAFDTSQLSLLELSACGAISGFVTSFARTPMELVKCWSQIHGTGTWQSTKDLLARYGVVAGLMNGIGPTMSREIPQFAVYYPIYEVANHMLRFDARSKAEMSTASICASGALAGVGCWVLTYPIDVVKTRIQVSPPNTYRGQLHCGIQIYLEGGIKPFFNGLVPTVVRAAILHSCIFLSYERVMQASREKKKSE